MNVNRRLRDALRHLGLPVAFNVDLRHRERCITFNYTQIPFQFADGRPVYWKYLVQVHLFLPLAEDSLPLREGAAGALVEAGFAWPEIQDLTGESGRQAGPDKQHIILETEIVGMYIPRKDNDGGMT